MLKYSKQYYFNNRQNKLHCYVFYQNDYPLYVLFYEYRLLNSVSFCFDQDCPERQSFLRRIEQLMHQLITYAPVDAACDQMGKKFIYDSLPPMLTEGLLFLYSNRFKLND